MVEVLISCAGHDLVHFNQDIFLLTFDYCQHTQPFVLIDHHFAIIYFIGQKLEYFEVIPEYLR